MDLSEIRKLVAEDMPIDDTELDVESMTIPQLLDLGPIDIAAMRKGKIRF